VCPTPGSEADDTHGSNRIGEPLGLINMHRVSGASDPDDARLEQKP